MSSLTKQAIIDCTLSLAEQKSLKKITVNDIVKACGITRNTFYYYFHDIYDVLDQCLSEELNKLHGCAHEEYDHAIFDLIEYVCMYKKVWRNLYKTVGQENLQRNIMRKVHVLFKDYISSQATVTPSNEDMEIICAFFEEALFGVLVRWLDGDPASISTPEEMHQFTERIRVLFKGVIPLLLENSNS